MRRPHQEQADVVVIGSGPAGSCAAATLTAAGLSVVILEEGGWLEPEATRLSAFGSMSRAYRGLGATMAVGWPPTPLVQGRAVGGTTPINGAICWRLPRDVYEGWVADDPALADGLPWEEVERATDAVEARWGVRPTDPAVAGRKNRLLAVGAEALGLEHRPIRRNVDGCRGSGRCLAGCPHGAKRSVDRTHLADALDGGARLMWATRAIRVVVEGGRAVGVEAVAEGGGRVTVRAGRAVVVAASAVQSPALLLASGVSRGPVGRGFQGHPGVSLAARFPDPVDPWDGATQGHEVTGLRREGVKIEVLSYDLTLLAARSPGVGAGLARAVEEVRREVVLGAAIRSSARGTVRRVLGRTLVTWSPTAEDLGRYRRAIGAMGALMFAAGAEAVLPAVRGLPSEIHDPDALRAALDAAPTSPAAYRAVITHLFGTCRLGSDPGHSVVRPDLRHHAVDRLYVVDSSVFPSNTGVNPQVSIAALATIGAAGIAR